MLSEYCFDFLTTVYLQISTKLQTLGTGKNMETAIFKWQINKAHSKTEITKEKLNQ